MLHKLEPEQRRTVNKIMNSGINFLSGTVSPAKADASKGDIESLEMGFEHFRKEGVTDVILQPKFMGSRATLYIFREDVDKCYAVTRGGFRIKKPEECAESTPEEVKARFAAIQEAVRKEHTRMLEIYPNEDWELVIVDAELMPWAALGKGLIDKTYRTFTNVLSNWMDTNNSGEITLEDVLQREVDTSTDFGKKNQSRKGEFVKNYVPQGTATTLLNKFNHQVELFGQECTPYFEPFNILKIVYDDGCEEILVNDNADNSCKLGIHHIRLDLTKHDENTPFVKAFLENIQEKELEGVMIKPAVALEEGKGNTPMLKVRNKEYLRIIYGWDYTEPNKLETLVKKKAVKSKVNASIKEYYLGMNILKIPYAEVNKNNSELLRLVASTMLSFSNTETLDPRL